MPSLNLREFRALILPGGFILSEVELAPGPLIDPIGRPALARTTIQGREIRITLDHAQLESEQSISIYHEALEGLTVAFIDPPVSVLDFCEADFEREAKAAHERLGFASAKNVLMLLKNFGFR